MSPLIQGFLVTIIPTSTPIILAALGGQLTSMNGKFNLGMEGMMLFSAFFSLYFTNIFSSLLMGMLLGCGVTMLLGAFMAFMVLKMKSNVYIVGIAINTLAVGVTTFLGLVLTGQQGTVIFREAPKLQNITLPMIDNIPYLGDFLSGHHVIDYLSIILTFAVFFLVTKTKFGRHNTATGLNEVVASAQGVNVQRCSYASYVLCGLLCGLGGAALTLQSSIFAGGSVGIVNGRGWIAMTIVIISMKKPIRVLVAAWILACITGGGDILQATTDFPQRLVMALPFIASLVACAIYSSRQWRADNGLLKRRAQRV
jgi:simple sugar transport system permease protein